MRWYIFGRLQGVKRATVLGLRLLREYKDLRSAIRAHLSEKRTQDVPCSPRIVAAVTAARKKEQKLFELYVDEKVDAEFFAEGQKSLRAQVSTLQPQLEEIERFQASQEEAVGKFEGLEGMLDDLDFDAIW